MINVFVIMKSFVIILFFAMINSVLIVKDLFKTVVIWWSVCLILIGHQNVTGMQSNLRAKAD